MKIECRNRGDKYRYVVWDEYGNHIIGSAVLIDSNQSALLKNVNVHRSRRGKGIGSSLLKRILSDFQNSEIVAKAFSSRLDWYRRHGFELKEEPGDLVKVRRTPQ